MKRRILSTLGIVLAAVFATAITACSGSTCVATTITPGIFTNGAWVQETSVTVNSTSATVNLGPQAESGGSWSWSGPNNFTSTAREIDNIKLNSGTNIYTVTYTNPCGASTTLSFIITVSAPAVLAPGDYNESITSSGLARTFILHIPTGYTGNTAVPAILDFHPAGVNASYMEGMSGWKSKCDTVGCIVVYPESGDSNLLWNGGYCCDGFNDVQFARDIITWLKANTNLDTTRVYASGGSNGAALGYALACQASDVIAAAALVDFRCVTGTDPGAAGATMSPVPTLNGRLPSLSGRSSRIPRSSSTKAALPPLDWGWWARWQTSRPLGTSAAALVRRLPILTTLFARRGLRARAV